MPGGNRLELAEREEISPGLARGESFTALAARLGRAVSTVSREVAANGGRAAVSGRGRRIAGRSGGPADPKRPGWPSSPGRGGQRVAGGVLVAVGHRPPLARWSSQTIP